MTLPRWPFPEDKLLGVLAFTVLIVPLAFTLFGYENFDTVKFSFWLILTGIAGLFFLFSSGKRQFAKLPNSLTWTLVVFLFWAILATLAAADFEHAFLGFYYRFTNGLVFFFLFTTFIILLIKTLNSEKANFIIKILAFDALAISVVGLLQVLGIGYYENLDQAGFVRAPSFLGNPNFSALFLALVLPWLVTLTIQAQSFSARIYYGLTTILSLFAIIAFSSRGALLAAVGGVLIYGAAFLYRNWSWKRLWVVCGSLATGLVILVIALQIVRPGIIKSTFSTKDVNVSLRLQVWRTTLAASFQHPWLGIGLGNFNIFFEQNHKQELLTQQGEFDDPHNLFLLLAVTGGYPLAAAFLILLLGAAFYCFKNLKNNLGWHKISALASVMAFAIGVCFNPVSVGVFLGLAVVLALSFASFEHEEQKKLNLPSRYILGTALMAAIVFGASLIIGEQFFAFGFRQYYEGKYQSSYKLIKIAEFVHPFNAYYKVFEIGDEVKLRNNFDLIPTQIENFKQQHPLESRGFVVAGKLYYLLYYTTHNTDYLKPAIDNVKRAAALDPSFVERYGLLSAYEFVGHQMSASMLHTNWELAGKPDEFSGWLLKAKINQTLGNKQATALALEQAFKLRPDLTGLKILLEQARTASDIKTVPIEVYLDESKID